MHRRFSSVIRARLTYANVLATLALLFAMSGGALAAKHYLINSTKQINPKVLKRLHGARGAIGPNGAAGPQGVQGPIGHPGNRGERGAPGFSALSLLPKGSTESGEFSVSAPHALAEEVFEGVATFPIPLAAPIETQVEVTREDVPTSMCLGPGTAEKGWLCIYTRSVRNLEFKRAYNPESELEVEPPGRTGRFGFGTEWKAEEEGPVEAAGTWSVTAR